MALFAPGSIWSREGSSTNAGGLPAAQVSFAPLGVVRSPARPETMSVRSVGACPPCLLRTLAPATTQTAATIATPSTRRRRAGRSADASSDGKIDPVGRRLVARGRKLLIELRPELG